MNIKHKSEEKLDLDHNPVMMFLDDYIENLSTQVCSIIGQNEIIIDSARKTLWDLFPFITSECLFGETKKELKEKEEFEALRSYIEMLKKEDPKISEIPEIREIAEEFKLKIVILGQKEEKEYLYSQKAYELLFVESQQSLLYVSKYQPLIPFIKNELQKFFEKINKNGESLVFAHSNFLNFKQKIQNLEKIIKIEIVMEELIVFQINYLSSLITKYFFSKVQTLKSGEQKSNLIFGEKNESPKNLEKIKENLTNWLKTIDSLESKELNMCITDIYFDKQQAEKPLGPPEQVFLQNNNEEQTFEYLFHSENKRHELFVDMKKNIKSQGGIHKILESLYPNELKLSKNPDPSKKKMILAIDGGGMKGIIPLMIMCVIEQRTSRYISDCFDLIGGTSIGSIIASTLVCPYKVKSKVPKYSAWEILYIMLSRSSQIFKPKFILLRIFSKYQSDTLSQFLEEFLGEAKMEESIKPLLIPTCTEQGNTIKHTSLKSHHLMKDVAMASSSAPTFFPPHKLDGIDHVDGGVTANNPALMLYDHAIDDLKMDPNNIVLVSLGTGKYISNMPTHIFSWATTGILYSIAAQVK